MRKNGQEKETGGGWTDANENGMVKRRVDRGEQREG